MSIFACASSNSRAPGRREAPDETAEPIPRSQPASLESAAAPAATFARRKGPLPQSGEVQVQRKLPAEIDIHVVERNPVAWITDEKQLADPFASDAAFLVDGRGVLMKEKKLLP